MYYVREVNPIYSESPFWMDGIEDNGNIESSEEYDNVIIMGNNQLISLNENKFVDAYNILIDIINNLEDAMSIEDINAVINEYTDKENTECDLMQWHRLIDAECKEKRFLFIISFNILSILAPYSNDSSNSNTSSGVFLKLILLASVDLKNPAVFLKPFKVSFTSFEFNILTYTFAYFSLVTLIIPVTLGSFNS